MLGVGRERGSNKNRLVRTVEEAKTRCVESAKRIKWGQRESYAQEAREKKGSGV